jgi:hypothetical protein
MKNQDDVKDALGELIGSLIYIGFLYITLMMAWYLFNTSEWAYYWMIFIFFILISFFNGLRMVIFSLKSYIKKLQYNKTKNNLNKKIK